MVVDHHSNSTAVVRRNVKTISIVAVAMAIYNYQREAGLWETPRQISWFIHWIDANTVDLTDLAHQG